MSSSSMVSPAPSHGAGAGAGASAGAGTVNAGNGAGQTDLFPLDFLSFSNFDTASTSPQTQSGGGGERPGGIGSGSGAGNDQSMAGMGMGMDFDFSQFQSGPDSHHGGHSASGSRRGSFAGGKRGSISSVGTGQGQGQGQGQGSTRPTPSASASAGMEVDLPNGHGPPSASDFQMMLDAASASASAAGPGGNNGETSFDQAGLLQQQLEHIHMQSPLVFGQINGGIGVPAGMTQAQGQGQGQSPYSHLAQYLASPLAQNQAIEPSSNNSSSSQEGGDAEKRKWMLATGLGGLFTPGPSGEMIPQVRPEHMSPMQLEILAREGFDGDFSSAIPLLSPALSQHQNSSAYTSPMASTHFASGNPHQIPFNTQHHLPPSPLEALQIQQRHFQEQLALLQHQQRQLQATAEAVAAASNSPYVPTAPGSGSASASRPATTPGVGSQGPHSSNASPSYFSPLTSPALEASQHRGQGHFARHQQHQHQQQGPHFSPGFDSRGNKRTPHPLSALSSPALNPVGSSGGAQQTLSPALAPQSNHDMSDPDYFRALTGMLDGNGNGNGAGSGASTGHQVFRPGHHQQRSQTIPGSDGSGSAYPSPINLQSIDTAALSSPLVGPLSAGSSSGPGPNRHSLPVRTRPSPMIKPTPAQRNHHSRNGSSHHSPVVATHHQRYNPTATVPQPNYLPPAAIDQRGVQAHHQQQQMALSTMSETPSPVDLSTIMPPPPVPNANNAKAVTPMTPATLMNLGAGRAQNQSQGQGQGQGQGQHQAAGGSDEPQQQQSLPKRQASVRNTQQGRTVRKASNSGTSTPTVSATGGSGASGAAGGSGKKVKIAPAGKRALAARPPGVGVRAATKGAAAAAALALPEGETRKTSHKAAEQKRRDSLKAGFDELRLLLPPINTEALDPESGEPIPGSSAPRLLPKSSLVPDDNPNRGVSKVALLKFGNEYIERLHEKVDKRDEYIDRLRSEVARLRLGSSEEVRGAEGEDLLEMNMLDGEEEYDGDGDQDEEGVEDVDELDLDPNQDHEDQGAGIDEEEDEGGMELDGDDAEDEYTDTTAKPKRRSKPPLPIDSPSTSKTKSPALNATKRPSVTRGLSHIHARGRKVEA